MSGAAGTGIGENPAQEQQSPEQGADTADKPKPPAPPTAEDHGYEVFARPDAYDTNIKPGNARLLILEPRASLNRHDDLTAHIARLSSEDMARRLGTERAQIFVREGNLGGRDFIPHLNDYDVVNYSVGADASNFAGIMMASEGGSNPAANFEGVTRPIIVQAVGNHGSDGGQLSFGAYDRDTTENIHFYRHSITVGEATRGPDGQMTVDAHSAKAGPTFVAPNRTETGTSFLYYEDITQLSPEARAEVTIDADGYVSNIQGTSFAAPDPAGAIASARNAFPNLSNTELLAAAVASARIPRGADTGEVRTNPSGLEYGAYKWGYGVFDPAAFETNLERMNAIRAEHGADADAEQSVTAFNRSTVERGGQTYHAHRFTITSDMSVEKITRAAQMPLQTRPPSQIILISPSGQEIEIPTSVGPGTTRMTTEAFMGADAKGDWTVLMAGNARIAQGEELSRMHEDIGAYFTVYGQEKGADGQSNISRLFEQVRDERAAELQPVSTNPGPTAPEAPATAPPPALPNRP